MSKIDPRGYYAALGLEPGASITSVKEAFRRLAKECHPDRAHVTDGGSRFRTISEAYEFLSDPQLKAAYDEVAVETPPPGDDDFSEHQTIEPICCNVCGKVTAQPRRLAFWRVTGFLFVSSKTPVQKIYCCSCATKEQWKSTLWTSVLGWWGIPWGPIWSVGHGLTNALGGGRDSKIDEALMWQNALAFACAGEGKLAVGLSNILRKSENADLAQRSADVIRFFSERGVDASAVLENVWKRSVVQTILLLVAVFAIPSVALAFAVSSSLAPRSTTVDTQNPYADLIPATSNEQGTASGEDALKEVFGNKTVDADGEARTNATPVPICSAPPSNGEILSDSRSPIEKGHILQIENGTEGDAIVKLRNAVTEKTVASFFVASGRTASLTRIPDGAYRVQYAFGGKLGADCRSFVEMASAGEFPDAETLKTEYQEELEGTRVSRSKLSYTLYATPGGNVRPDHIAAAEFNKP